VYFESGPRHTRKNREPSINIRPIEEVQVAIKTGGDFAIAFSTWMKNSRERER